MEKGELDYLSKFYKKLNANINKILKKSTQSQSPILIFIKTYKKNILEVLSKAAISKSSFSEQEIFEKLLNKKYIREGNNSSEYLITPKGIWMYENECKLFNIDDYLNYIDKEYFNLFKGQNEPLDPREKIVLLGMIAIRSFSENSWIDVNIEENTNDWKEIFEKTKRILIKLKVIDENQAEKLWKKKKSGSGDITDPIFYLLRHMNDLPAKTNNLYKSSGNKEYYLDLPEKNPKTLRTDLISLLRKVFDKKDLNQHEKESIILFCNEISFDYSPSLFYNREHKFSNPTFDEFLREIILYYNLN